MVPISTTVLWQVIQKNPVWNKSPETKLDVIVFYFLFMKQS